MTVKERLKNCSKLKLNKRLDTCDFELDPFAINNIITTLNTLQMGFDHSNNFLILLTGLLVYRRMSLLVGSTHHSFQDNRESSNG